MKSELDKAEGFSGCIDGLSGFSFYNAILTKKKTKKMKK